MLKRFFPGKTKKNLKVKFTYGYRTVIELILRVQAGLVRIVLLYFVCFFTITSFRSSYKFYPFSIINFGSLSFPEAPQEQKTKWLILSVKFFISYFNMKSVCLHHVNLFIKKKTVYCVAC